MKKVEVFPTPIWFKDFSDADALNIFVRLSDLILKEVKEKPTKSKSNAGDSLHTEVDFAGVIGDLEVGALLLPALIDATVRYWGIVSNKNSYNKRHHHPGGLLSGVLYLSTPPGSGNLVLVDPRYGKMMETMTGRSNDHPGSLLTMKADKGRLIVFPSWLEHEVEFTTADQPRIILSFNFNPIK